MSTINRILIIDDEENIRTLVHFNLEKNSFIVTEAADGKEALELVRQKPFDLILLDLMLPEIDGLTVCRTLKADPATSSIPIIMLTAKSEEIDKVLGLELGADDYIVKPFAPRELIARIKAVLRRSTSLVRDKQLVFGPLQINSLNYEATLDGAPLALTPKEFELLSLLVAHPGQAFSRERLLAQVWGYEYFGDMRTVDVHIRHLRAKLAVKHEADKAIETVRGLGYRFNEKKLTH